MTSKVRTDEDWLYQQRHKMVKNHRGEAHLYDCEWCGEPASDWATIHNRKGWGPEDYQPMCRSCHRKYDLPFERGWDR